MPALGLDVAYDKAVPLDMNQDQRRKDNKVCSPS
jgi:hypothetical protein